MCKITRLFIDNVTHCEGDQNALSAFLCTFYKFLSLQRATFLFFFLFLFCEIRCQVPSLIVPVGHFAAISAVVFSPDGHFVVTNGGEEKNVKIWETKTGRLIRTIEAHADQITSVSFSNNGKYLLTTGHDHKARVWDVQSGKVYYDVYFSASNWIEDGAFSKDDRTIVLTSDMVMERHDLQNKKLIKTIFDSSLLTKRSNASFTERFLSCKFSSDGKKAVTTNADSSVRMWNLETGKVVVNIREPGAVFQNAIFSPSGNKFMAATEGLVSVRNTMSGTEIFALHQKNKPIIFETFSPDDKYIITVAADSAAKLWDAQTGKLLKTFQDPTAIIVSCIFSNNGLLITLSAEGVARLWEINSGKMIRIAAGRDPARKKAHPVLDPEDTPYLNASFSNDSKFIVTALLDNKAIVQETTTGKVISSLSGISSMIYNPEYSCDGKLLATCGVLNTIDAEAAPRGVVSIWDLQSGKIVFKLEGHKGLISEIKFSSDNKLIATASNDSTARIWDAATGNLLNVFPGHEKEVYKCYFAGGSKYLITQTFSGMARVWDTQSGKRILEIKNDSSTDRNGLYTITLSKNGKYFKTVFYDDYRTLITEPATGKTLMNFDTRKDTIKNVIFDPGEKYLLYTKNNTIVVKDIISGKSFVEISCESAIYTVRINKKGDLLAANFQDSTIKVWELPSGKLVGDFKPGNSKYSFIEFTADDKYMLTYSIDSSVKVWEAATLRLVKKINISGEEMYVSNITLDGRHYVVTRTFEHTMNIRDMESGQLINSVPDKFNSDLSENINPQKPQFVIDNKFSCDIYELGHSLPMLTLITAGNAEYLVIDSMGRYDGSEAARKILYFTCGTEIIELDQVKDHLWIPNLAERTFNKEPINSDGLSGINICGVTPVTEAKEDKGTAYIFKITPRSGGIGETVLLVNNIEAKRYKPSELQKIDDSYQLKVSRDELKNFFIPGKQNAVTIRAYTNNNSMSSRGASVDDDETNKHAGMPNLFAVVVGISDYKGDELDLQFAAKDATDISSAISGAAKKLLNTDGNDHVFMYNLTTGKNHFLLPEKNSIKSVLQQIGKKATANDILLIFFAGHGMMGGEKKQFYFLTSDASKLSAANDVASVGISTRELAEWMRPQNIKAQKRILIFDACSSGQAIKDFVKMGNSDQNYLTARDDENAQQIKEIDRLNEKSGLFILSASASNQRAYEMGRYSQGLLTYSLLKAIKEDPSILEDGKYLNVSRWFNAAEKSVIDLSKENGARQEPQIVTTTNFNIGIVDQEVMANINLPSEKPVFAASVFLNNDETINDDDIELSKIMNMQLANISSRGTDSKILYITGINSANAYTLTGRYQVKGNLVTVKVNVKQGKVVKYKFEIQGEKDKLAKFAEDIIVKAADLVNSK